jgi:oligopeptide transport system permease protein
MSSPIPQAKFELAQKIAIGKDAAFQTPPIGYLRDVLTRFMRNKASVAAFALISIIVLMAIIGPSLNRYGFNDQFLDQRNMPPRIPGLAKLGIADGTRVLVNRRLEHLHNLDEYPEGCIIDVFNHRTVQGIEVVDVKVDFYLYKDSKEAFWFGTDYLGRDLWTRLWRGCRVSLVIAFVAVFCNMLIGVFYGAIAGYYGGAADMLLMRLCEIIQSIPRVVIVTLFILYFGTGMFSIVMSLIISGWIITARLVRAQFYRFKTREYVLAARTMGVSDMAIMFRHILPNSIGPIITTTMIAVPNAIFTESFLAYIGLGLQAPEPSIGVLLAEGQKVLLNYPFQTLFPGIIISILMVSFNLFANGLRDALDPTLRGTEG